MKTIPYKSKATNSNANYKETLTSDTKWILNQCKRLVEVASDCETANLKEGERLLNTNPNMPKQSTGSKNSCKSMCEGTIGNFSSGQYDLTDKTIKGITEAFRIGEEIISDFEAVEFVEVSSLPKLSPKKEVDVGNTTFSDFFEVESIVVRTETVYRKKQ